MEVSENMKRLYGYLGDNHVVGARTDQSQVLFHRRTCQSHLKRESVAAHSHISGVKASLSLDRSNGSEGIQRANKDIYPFSPSRVSPDKSWSEENNTNSDSADDTMSGATSTPCPWY